MAYLSKGKKQDIIELARELDIPIDENFRIFDIKDAITKSVSYDEEFTRGVFLRIIEERKENEALQASEKKKAEEQERLSKEQEKQNNFELEKLRLQIEAQRMVQPSTIASVAFPTQPQLQLKNLIPEFDVKEDDMSLYLNLFERQLKFFKVEKSSWVAYLLGVLPTDVAQLVAREPEEQSQDYDYIKGILLQRFRLTAEKFRKRFSQAKKNPEMTWKDFFFELRTFFEGWLEELKITSFTQLKDLIICDQMKRRSTPECRQHYLDVWENLNNPSELAEKLDSYEGLRPTTPGAQKKMVQSKSYQTQEVKRGASHPRRGNFGSRNFDIQRESRESWIPSQNARNHAYPDRAQFPAAIPRENRTENHSEERPVISCYGCGKLGVIKRKCPTCSPTSRTETTELSSLHFKSLSLKNTHQTLLKVSINGINGVACADTGASNTIAGEMLYNLLKENGTTFQTAVLNVTLADGIEKETEAHHTEVDINVEGQVVKTKIFALPTAKDNRTLLGTDFLQKAGIVLNVPHHNWYFINKPGEKYPFVEDPFPKTSNATADFHSIHLREDEGQHLTEIQKAELNGLIEEFEDIFQPGEVATPKIQHFIDTCSSKPVSLPPYRMSPAKKELLQKELDILLENGTIEECESPYASPVVLVPKPDGSMRLCIDYRKLSAVTVSDNYPLPRMDDLLHEARHTSYMSTLDLKSGYHQIEVNPADRDKTAFICPLGVYRYRRMPFGLKNAPATFQRLIDNFRNSLKDIMVLSYLDDIIVLSETFEEHLSNLEAVFTKLQEFKLQANREKCHFGCNRVKYLGHYITQNGLEVDPGKTAAIQNIPPPRNVKQVQSFLQTCSWYRRFIENFSEIARPLSNLTKKTVKWNWGPEEERSFNTLKSLLVKPPILRQSDPTKPYILRTDASNYALGAVLLQGSGPDEHPIEYASRLLNQAEKNYSTTEREALAVVWALKKFRAYIDGQEVIVASDHQPLKWLMCLKSPTGRLARWALEVQSFNLKVEYIPGKINVVADMLSRPFCQHAEGTCEICTVSIDMPTRSSKNIREEQLKDDNLKKIIEFFENVVKDENFANYSERGYLMNQGILYRYSPDSDSEEAQLVVPEQERENILKEHHDAPTAGHYGSEGTYTRIANRYYWIGMRKYITDYVKNCLECNRYKASNQKPAGLLRTPIYSQRFETLAIDLFGPLPETPDGKKWIFIIEDTSTKWVELFALQDATARECAITLLEEVFLRYGLPRRLISDNGSQFVSAVMQQICNLLDIDQVLTPVYCPQANPVERKNRDLKPRIAILVGNGLHTAWSEKLPLIRFSMNSAECSSTGYSAAFLQFGREMRTPDDVKHDLRSVIHNDNFVAEITPYLKRLAENSKFIRERVEMKQDQRKLQFDKGRRQVFFNPGDKGWVTLHPRSSARNKKTAKFMPKRDGPYQILTQRSPTSYVVASIDNPTEEIATYHVSALSPYRDQASGEQTNTSPVSPLRKRGRPPKRPPTQGPTPGPPQTQQTPNPEHSSGRRHVRRGRL